MPPWAPHKHPPLFFFLLPPALPWLCLDTPLPPPNLGTGAGGVWGSRTTPWGTWGYEEGGKILREAGRGGVIAEVWGFRGSGALRGGGIREARGLLGIVVPAGRGSRLAFPACPAAAGGHGGGAVLRPGPAGGRGESGPGVGAGRGVSGSYGRWVLPQEGTGDPRGSEGLEDPATASPGCTRARPGFPVLRILQPYPLPPGVPRRPSWVSQPSTGPL